MRRRLFFWELAGFLFTGALGVLLHFLYEWSGGNTLAAAFSAVNESTWEHMKLLFFPMFVFSVFQVCIMGRNYPNFLAARAASILTGLVLIPVLFYTYTGVLGRNINWVDIAIFFLADLGAFLLDAWLLRRGKLTAADSGSADSMGGGILLCLVYVPASQTGPVDGPGDRHVWRLEYRIPHRSKACGSLRPVFSRSHGCEWEIPLTAFAKRRIIGDSNRKRRNRSCRKRTRPTG